jgi:hypothetical protein
LWFSFSFAFSIIIRIISSSLGCAPVFGVGAATGAVVTLVLDGCARPLVPGLPLAVAGLPGGGLGTCAKVVAATNAAQAAANSRWRMWLGV